MPPAVLKALGHEIPHLSKLIRLIFWPDYHLTLPLWPDHIRHSLGQIRIVLGIPSQMRISPAMELENLNLEESSSHLHGCHWRREAWTDISQRSFIWERIHNRQDFSLPNYIQNVLSYGYKLSILIIESLNHLTLSIINALPGCISWFPDSNTHPVSRKCDS